MLQSMPVMGVAQFERFFRVAAGLDIDKSDLKRYNDFVFEKLSDLLIRGEANAKANLRDIIEPWDLPITKGLQERIHEFRRLDQEAGVEPFIERIADRPNLELGLSEETQERLPEIAGGLSVALARAFPLLDTNVKNPQTEQWNRAFQLFRLLL
jgi:hypothetical protein